MTSSIVSFETLLAVIVLTILFMNDDEGASRYVLRLNPLNVSMSIALISAGVLPASKVNAARSRVTALA